MRFKLLSIFAGISFALTATVASPICSAQLVVSVNIAPPPLPVYEQPPIPAEGWIWTPGYWSWGPQGYYWVPGTWVEPPEVGLLWTPGYWGWSDGVYVWNAGYWGPVVGFYGGINYGFGYVGRGYEGGYWRGNQFYYNTTVNNVTNVHVTNVYNRTVVNNVTANRVSYNGGAGGVVARPTADEEQAARQPHTAATPAQTQQREAAASRRDLLASVNNGKPAIAATSRPNEFSSHVVGASRAGGPVHAAPASGPAAATFTHARDIPRPEAVPEPSAGASAEERDYAQRQSDLQAKQEQERKSLAEQQEKEHAAYSQQQSQNKEAYAAMERQHMQQTQQMQQRHATEARQIQRPPAPARREPPPR